jgi:uncharacterized protein (DUF2336 family)
MNPDVQALISDVDATIGKTPAPQITQILRSVIDLFLQFAPAYSADQLAVFDDVILRLIAKVGPQTLTELSTRLASAGQAPRKVACMLAGNDNLAICGPLLESCESLPDDVLAGIAKAKGPKYLAAIANRARIGESVADVLAERGDSDLAQKVAANQGARFSELGYVKVINRAKSDRALATAIATRTDTPPELMPFLKLALGEKKP